MKMKRLIDGRGNQLTARLANPSEWEIERTYREGTNLVVIYHAAKKISPARYRLEFTYAECMLMFGTLADPA